MKVSQISSTLLHVTGLYSSIDGHLGGFHFLVVVNTAAVNTGVQMSVYAHALCVCVCVCV